MINDISFSAALSAFNKKRSSIVGCLRSAIEAFKIEEAKRISNNSSYKALEIFSINTDNGPDTGLVILGFTSISETENFLIERLNVPGK